MKKFRSGSQWITRGLFLETSYSDQSQVIYTLKDEDDEARGHKSLYKLYLTEEDLTEYDFANKYLGGWEHWQAIATATWFKPYITRWRKELELKVKAEALKAIMDEARAGGKNSFTALRFLVEKGWIERPEGKRGRPTKEEIKTSITSKELEDDWDRINVQ